MTLQIFLLEKIKLKKLISVERIVIHKYKFQINPLNSSKLPTAVL